MVESNVSAITCYGIDILQCANGLYKRSLMNTCPLLLACIFLKAYCSPLLREVSIPSALSLRYR